LDTLRRVCGSAASGDVVDAVDAAYRHGQTIGGAYVALLRRLLEPLGVAVLDASHRSYLDAARPILQRALNSSAAIARELAATNRAITKRGFAPQVDDDRGLSLVFVSEKG